MRIVSIGGGPAGLYFSILMKKLVPEASIEVFERNGRDDTFGWGVVFSEETLEHFADADPPSWERIRDSFVYWDDIDTHVHDTVVTSTGHGFCGLARRRLLNILQDRAEELGVTLVFDSEVEDIDAVLDADLVLGADGVNSRVRERYSNHFRPHLDWRKCKFCWLGTTLPLDAFTFIFKETPHGVFQVHAYPFEEKLSTFIVECREDTWRDAGLAEADEAETVRFCEELFSGHLEGHRLLTNRSIWRTFPTVRVDRWHHENIVLIGDAAHTAHFSIGSGTKLAMEDAIALRDAFDRVGTRDVESALDSYEESRRVDVLKIQKAAQTSLEWFENSARYMKQDPIQFTFNLMTRSKRITYDNLALRDPVLVRKTDEVFMKQTRGRPASDGSIPPPIFQPFELRSLRLDNRIVVSPMCQYSAHEGTVGDWHLVHLASRAIGGAGLVMTEMTDVTPEGRITTGCAGLWRDEHVAAWQRIVRFVRENSQARIGIQLAHAGRKGSVRHPWDGPDVPLPANEGWETIAPSAIPFEDGWPAPREMTRADMDAVRDAFVSATHRAIECGFDLVEVHMAHGYLLSSFLSPLSNRRRDEYGGTLENRMRFPLEVFDAMRDAWPEELPMIVRISATDWLEPEGFTADESVVLARRLADHGCDLIDVSTAGNSPRSAPVYGRMYQVPFAERIRYEANVPVMAVGAILGADHANTILAAGRADLCALARPHLREPYLSLAAATHYRYPDAPWPGQYLRGRIEKTPDEATPIELRRTRVRRLRLTRDG